MRRATIIAIAPMAFVTIVMLSTPAAATKAQAAWMMCAHNPKCSANRVGDTVTFCVEDSGGPKSCAKCVGKKNCYAYKEGGKPTGGSITGVLTGGNAPPTDPSKRKIDGGKAPISGVNQQPPSGSTTTIYRSGGGRGGDKDKH